MREETFRRGFLIGAGVCWATSIILVFLLVSGEVSTKTGLTSVVVLIQSVAVTLSVVWAQFRVRAIMTAVLKAGMELEESRKKEGQ